MSEGTWLKTEHIRIMEEEVARNLSERGFGYNVDSARELITKEYELWLIDVTPESFYSQNRVNKIVNELIEGGNVIRLYEFEV